MLSCNRALPRTALGGQRKIGEAILVGEHPYALDHRPANCHRQVVVEHIALGVGVLRIVRATGNTPRGLLRKHPLETVTDLNHFSVRK